MSSSTNGHFSNIKFIGFIWIAAFLWCNFMNTVYSKSYPCQYEQEYRGCQDNSFCMRLRAYNPDESPYQFLMNSIKVANSSSLVGKIINIKTREMYNFSIQCLKQSTFRFQMKEETVYHARFHPGGDLHEELFPEKFKLINRSSHEIVGQTDAVYFKLIAAPAKLELYNIHDKETPSIVMNDMGQLVMEYNQPEKGSEKYYESFHNFVDTRPYGPMAHGVDFSFPKAQNLYGLPTHLGSLVLKSTRNTNPYRIFNIDFNDQRQCDRRSMYGSIPFAISHGVKGTTGVFWYNAADTYVDVDTKLDGSPLANYSSLHFMSETGALDAFFFLGPTFYEVNQQYAAVTGKGALPPYFSIGYHQSKWNYFTQQEVLDVVDNFDKHNFPLDTIWLDIEYTNGKRYFTWDLAKFPEPIKMINTLAAKNRKLVLIIDPHIKVDPKYKIYKDGIDKGLFVRYRNGSVFNAQSWPKDSVWFDFTNPEACEYWSTQFLPENFKNTTEDVFYWNDMNEPSVFDGPENTFPKDLIHFHNWEHRDVHNLYGLLEVKSTYSGLVKRSNGRKRPFILSRSFFSGSQRYTAIWLGDNKATFTSMKNSIVSCVVLSMTGISFCGADIGGFYPNPCPELLMRWYQLGAFLPFYREHYFYGLPSREPYYQNEPIAKLIREALQDRQIFLPFWYTTFYTHSVTGKPVIRPLLAEFPTEADTFVIDYEYLIGEAILVYPLTQYAVTRVEVYLPGNEDTLWYPYRPVSEAYQPGKYFIELSPSYNTTLVFVRGEHIIPKCTDAQQKPLPTAKDVFNSDITLYIAPSRRGRASGFLFIDDGESFAYQKKQFATFIFEFESNTLRAKFADNNKFQINQSVSQIEIAGERTYRKAFAYMAPIKMELKVVSRPHITYVLPRRGLLSLNKQWTVTFE